MTRSAWIVMAAGFAAGVGTAAAQPLSWPADAPRLVSHQMVSSTVMFDLLRVERLVGGESGSSWHAGTYSLDASSFTYTLVGAQTYNGQAFTLTTTGVFDGVDTWTTTTTGSVGLIDLSAMLRTKITLGPSGFSAMTRDAAAPKMFEPDENWTVEVSPGGGFAVSTHNTSGAKDRGVLNPNTHRYDWTITKQGKAEAYGMGGFDLPSQGSFTFIVPTPGTLALIGLGMGVLARRRT
ncbi:MAG: hypothetical protein SFY95_05955 [Planctomycetota bacterium]|nr:hypothetical protein [Planctomycetota bacterium]